MHPLILYSPGIPHSAPWVHGGAVLFQLAWGGGGGKPQEGGGQKGRAWHVYIQTDGRTDTEAQHI